MTNPDLILLQYLNGQEALRIKVGQRIWAGPDLPPDYKPALGPAALFSARGGGIDFAGLTIKPSFTFRYFAATREIAEDTHAAFYPYLMSARTSVIKHAALEGVPTFLTDPVTGWPFVLAFYSVVMSNA